MESRNVSILPQFVEAGRGERPRSRMGEVSAITGVDFGPDICLSDNGRRVYTL